MKKTGMIYELHSLCHHSQTKCHLTHLRCHGTHVGPLHWSFTDTLMYFPKKKSKLFSYLNEKSKDDFRGDTNNAIKYPGHACLYSLIPPVLPVS